MEVGRFDLDNITANEIVSIELIEALFDISSHLEHEFARQQIELKAEELGSKVKLRFTNLYKAASREKKELDALTNTSTSNNEVDYDVADMPKLFCGPWIADERGVRKYVDRGVGGSTVYACPHPIYIKESYLNVQTDKERVKLSFKKRNKWRDITIDKLIIASANKIVNLADFGVSVTSENARHLVSFLAELESSNVDVIPQKNSTSKLGWINGRFIPYDINIEFDDQTRFKSVFDAIKEEGSREEWISLVRGIRATGRREPMFCLIASFASILIEKLNALPFILNIWGETGKGKTVALMLAASVWGEPGMNGYLAKARGTETSLEVRLDFLNHLPLCLDDLSQLRDEYRENFSEFVYMLCSGRSKERSNRDLGINRAMTWSNIILTNIERSLVSDTMKAGAINRIIDVEMDDGYIFEYGNKVVEILNSNYGFGGKMFVDLIEDIGIDSIKEIQKDYLARIQDEAKRREEEKEEKQMIPMSILLAVDKLIEQHIFKDGVRLDFDYCYELIKCKDDISENDRAYDDLWDIIHINEVSFDKYYQNGQVVKSASTKSWGIIEKDYVWIYPVMFKNICKEIGCSEITFKKWLKKNDLIRTSDNRYDIQKKIKGKPTRFICLNVPEDKEEWVQIPLGELPDFMEAINK